MRRRNAGFTLIELLIVLVIIGVILFLLWFLPFLWNAVVQPNAPHVPQGYFSFVKWLAIITGIVILLFLIFIFWINKR